jgi:hypothetical protein
MFPDWRGATVIVIASGASAKELAPRFHRTNAAPVLAINLCFRLAPGAALLYAADSGFWQWYKDARQFAGVKVAPDERARAYCKTINLIEIPKDAGGRRIDPMIFDRPGLVGFGGGNSGFQAVNLAINLGARRIALVGFDYCGGHWHEDHPPALRNPTVDQLRRWRERLDAAAPAIAARGVEVVNLSDRSALKAYPHASPDSLFVDP